MNDAQHNDGYPWTWEPAALTATLLLIITILATQIGRTTALLLTGAGVWWPTSQQLTTSSWAILGGDITAGLPTHVTASAPIGLVWTMTALTALVMCSGCAWAMWRIRAGASTGMATADQARHLLGHHRLRQNRSIIRPDLYPKPKPKPKARARS